MYIILMNRLQAHLLTLTYTSILHLIFDVNLLRDYLRLQPEHHVPATSSLRAQEKRDAQMGNSQNCDYVPHCKTNKGRCTHGGIRVSTHTDWELNNRER